MSMASLYRKILALFKVRMTYSSAFTSEDSENFSEFNQVTRHKLSYILCSANEVEKLFLKEFKCVQIAVART